MDVARVVTVMTPFPQHVDAAEDLWTARAMMQEHGIRHLPVMRHGRLAGILSERDLDLAMAMAGDHASEAGIPVWAICRRDAYCVDLDTPIGEVATAMADRQIGCALVTRKGKLAGIVTTVDICRALASLTEDSTPDVPA